MNDWTNDQTRTSSAAQPEHSDSVSILVTGQNLESQTLSIHQFFEFWIFEYDGLPLKSNECKKLRLAVILVT